MAFWRRRLVYTAVSVLAIAAYFSFISIVQQAVLTARKAANRPHSSKHLLPTVTGYSLEMQFRTSPVYTCSSLLKMPEPRSIRVSNTMWQNPFDSAIYLFSAHFDDRLNADGKRYPFIRLLAMSDGVVNSTFFCQMWIGKQLVMVTGATAKEIWYDSWDQKTRSRAYRPYLFSCPIIGLKRHPEKVSLVLSTCASATNLLEVVGNDKKMDEIISSGSRRDFAICVKGLDFSADNSLKLVEWMEIHRILGAQHFTFYMYHVHRKTLRVLKYYQQLGISSVVPITLPGEQPNFPPERTKFLRRNLWQKRRNELIPYNDCYYRHARNYRYVVPVDIDEMIVPIQHENWTRLFNYLQETDPNLVEAHSSLSAQQVYFLEVNQKEEDFQRANASGIPYYLNALRQTRRAADFAPFGHGVKSFMSGDKCLTVFNHYALESLYSGSKRDVLLPTHLVQLNHYRKDCPPVSHKDCPQYLSKTVVDLGLWKYKELVTKNVQRVATKLDLLDYLTSDPD